MKKKGQRTDVPNEQGIAYRELINNRLSIAWLRGERKDLAISQLQPVEKNELELISLVYHIENVQSASDFMQITQGMLGVINTLEERKNFLANEITQMHEVLGDGFDVHKLISTIVDTLYD